MEGKSLSEIVIAKNPPVKNISPGELVITTDSVIYHGLPVLSEVLALPKEFQESYLLYLIRLGINDSQKLAIVLGADIVSANKLAAEHSLFDVLAEAEKVAKVQNNFEENILKGRGFATINLRAAIAKAQTMTSGFPAGSVERAIKDMLKSARLNLMEPLSVREIAIAKEHLLSEQRKGRNKKMKKELYGIEQVIGKPAKDMNENDLEKAIAGCPIEPIYDEEQFLNNESYIRSLFCYFPHIPTSRIVEYLFNKGCGCTIFKKVQAKIRELGIRQNVVSKDESLYEQAAFIGWATKDVYKGLEFIAKYAKGKKEDMKIPGASIDTQSQNPKQENAPVEERDMTKAKPIPVETYEQEIAPAKKRDTPQTDPAPTKEPAAQTGNVRFEAVMSGELSQIFSDISTMMKFYGLKINGNINIG